jgi:hypothetical protein
MTQQQTKELLAKQLQLLSEKSQEACAEDLARLSEAMAMVANSLLVGYTE